VAGWNYRVVKQHPRSYYEIHEVYYDDAGKPNGLTVRGIGPGGDNREEFKSSADMYAEALYKPVLIFDGDDFIGEEPPFIGKNKWTEKDI